MMATRLPTGLRCLITSMYDMHFCTTVSAATARHHQAGCSMPAIFGMRLVTPVAMIMSS